MSVINNIIRELKQKGYTQLDLATALKDKGVSKQTITDWKSGKSNTHYMHIVDIANFLGVSTDYLLTDNPVTAPQSDVINFSRKEAKQMIVEMESLDFELLSFVIKNPNVNEQKILSHFGDQNTVNNRLNFLVGKDCLKVVREDPLITIDGKPMKWYEATLYGAHVLSEPPLKAGGYVTKAEFDAFTKESRESTAKILAAIEALKPAGQDDDLNDPPLPSLTTS